jgi:hypothetical protein
MLLARRKFVQSSLLFAASAFLFSESAGSVLAQALSGDGQLSTEVLRDPVFRFTRETFEPYVGGYFEAPGPRGKLIALKLIRIDVYEAKSTLMPKPGVETNSFTLVFKAEAELPTFTSIHPIKHGALGEFNLFLTRRGGDDGEIYYEAVFNHLLS